jgi:type I restriction enzyme S subunit
LAVIESYDTPPGWTFVWLGEAFEFTQKPSSVRYSDHSQVVFVPMDAVPIGYPFVDRFELRCGAAVSSGTYFERDDLLVAKITPSFENGKQGIVRSMPDAFGVATTEVIPIRGVTDVSDTLFLFYYLLRQCVRAELAGRMEGTTGRQRLSKATLENWLVLLPPLEQQQAIGHTLQAVQDAIQKRRDEIALEQERKAALMHHLFTYGTRGAGAPAKPTMFGETPERWAIVPLERCAYVQGGVTLGRRFDNEQTIMKPYLRVANVQDGCLDLTTVKELCIPESEVERYRLRSGDVVLTEGGDADKLGRGVIWRGQIPDCLHQNHLFAVRSDRNVLLPEFLAYLVQSQYGKAYFWSVAHRTTNLASINSTKLKAFPVVLPSLGEQADIVTALEACDATLAGLERERIVIQELFDAMLEELMAGRLCPPVEAVKE